MFSEGHGGGPRQRVSAAHSLDAAAHVLVEHIRILLQDREELVAESGPPHHPLVVAPAVMGVGAVEAAARKRGLEPTEQTLVADVHAQRDLGLASVAAEVALAHE